MARSTLILSASVREILTGGRLAAREHEQWVLNQKAEPFKQQTPLTLDLLFLESPFIV